MSINVIWGNRFAYRTIPIMYCIVSGWVIGLEIRGGHIYGIFRGRVHNI